MRTRGIVERAWCFPGNRLRVSKSNGQQHISQHPSTARPSFAGRPRAAAAAVGRQMQALQSLAATEHSAGERMALPGCPAAPASAPSAPAGTASCSQLDASTDAAAFE